MLTINQIKTLFPRAGAAQVAAFAANNAALFAEFGINKNLFRTRFFLAQIGHESGGLTVERENMNYSAARLMVVWPKRFPTLEAAQPFAGNPEKLGNFVYAGRNGNGPVASGDGFRYRGRGYVQLTGREGYREVGAIAGLPLEADPDLAFKPEHALRVALCFWKWKKANPVCDTGDFRATTKLVNGGTIGWDDRLAWLDKATRVVISVPARSLQPTAPLVILVQKALRDRGFTAIGAADGIIGSRTMAAIASFRDAHGLGAGAIDDLLVQSLGIVWP